MPITIGIASEPNQLRMLDAGGGRLDENFADCVRSPPVSKGNS